MAETEQFLPTSHHALQADWTAHGHAPPLQQAHPDFSQPAAPRHAINYRPAQPQAIQRRQSSNASRSPASTSHSLPSTAKEVQPARPQNAWILFRTQMCKERKLTMVGEKLTQGELSKVIAAQWKSIAPEIKRSYELQAEIIKQQHAVMYPNFRMRGSEPKRKTPAQIAKKQKKQAAKLAAAQAPPPADWYREQQHRASLGRSDHSEYSSSGSSPTDLPPENYREMTLINPFATQGGPAHPPHPTYGYEQYSPHQFAGSRQLYDPSVPHGGNFSTLYESYPSHPHASSAQSYPYPPVDYSYSHDQSSYPKLAPIAISNSTSNGSASYAPYAYPGLPLRLSSSLPSLPSLSSLGHQQHLYPNHAYSSPNYQQPPVEYPPADHRTPVDHQYQQN